MILRMILRMILGKKFINDCLKNQNECKLHLEKNKELVREMKSHVERCSYLTDMFLFVFKDEANAMECLELHRCYSQHLNSFQDNVNTYIGLILSYDEMMGV